MLSIYIENPFPKNFTKNVFYEMAFLVIIKISQDVFHIHRICYDVHTQANGKNILDHHGGLGFDVICH